MRSLNTWNFIIDNLDRNTPVMMLYVLDSRGSSPGRPGFFMAVNKWEEMSGSIGGGIMEHKWVEVAKEKLRMQDTPAPDLTVKKQVHDKSASRDQSGMICSGEQTILLYRVTDRDKPPIMSLIHSLQHFGKGELVLSPDGLDFNDNPPMEHFYFKIDEDSWIYRERTGYRCELTIIGGGHCSLALSKLIADLDFYIRVFDDRPGLNTMSENIYAHEKILLGDYSELATRLPDLDSHYVVIMTLGYRTDAIAVRTLAGRNFKYCGLLGSRKKIETMLDDLKQEGVDPAWLESLYTPIGISIKSQTPEEIAVSIAAQIISVRNS